jgi:hypothetical protein
MRFAHGPDAAGGRGDAYYSPDRPRIADPDQRFRLAACLSEGVRVGAGYRTDGAWVWPDDAARLLLDRGIAPEPDFLEYMKMRGYRLAREVDDEDLRRAARLAHNPPPPKQPTFSAVYFVRVEEDYPLDAPLSLLRKVIERSGAQRDEALWRDLRWHPTHAFAVHARAGTGEMDLREVPAEHASRVIDRWCAKWHAEASETTAAERH